MFVCSYRKKVKQVICVAIEKKTDIDIDLVVVMSSLAGRESNDVLSSVHVWQVASDQRYIECDRCVASVPT